MARLRIAATCVALPVEDGLAGVLIRGPSGAGKSDLALRLIDCGALLVADDLVLVAQEDGKAIASAPETIRGRIEVRGVGIVAMPAASDVALALAIDLAAAEVPRLPQPSDVLIGAVRLPRLVLNPFESSAVAKIRLAVQALNARRMEGVTFPFAWQ
jgi:HPr kinase/phosphorylase